MTAVLALSMPEISLVFFLVFFVCVVARLFATGKDRWQQHAQLPLDDQNHGGTDRVN
jgi:cbb3-type cytochrome oxidase subunit 3